MPKITLDEFCAHWGEREVCYEDAQQARTQRL